MCLGEQVGGFLAGLGKGLLGGVIKPTAGMLDLAAKTSDGYVNAANDASAEFAGRYVQCHPGIANSTTHV